jgi:perosamine synthetase
VTTEFEQKFSAYCNAKFGVATTNGTTALHAALLAVGIKPGDKVLTTPFTFVASTNSIVFCGAKPVFADIDIKTSNLDPNLVRDILKKRRDIKAILLVHLYGMACDMDAFLDLKKEFGVLLIEDCAQAHGALYKGKKVGSMGDVATFSFYATKNMTTGEGGMVLTNNQATADLVRKLVNHGRMGQYEHDILGYNYRMTNFAAALGIGQLEKLDASNQRRQEIARAYDKEFANLSWITTPFVPPDRSHVYHQYTIRVQKRDALKQHLTDNQIGSFIVYPIPNCQQPLYKGTCDCESPNRCVCKCSGEAAREVLSIPVHPMLSDDDVNYIVTTVKKFQELNHY